MSKSSKGSSTNIASGMEIFKKSFKKLEVMTPCTILELLTFDREVPDAAKANHRPIDPKIVKALCSETTSVIAESPMKFLVTSVKPTSNDGSLLDTFHDSQNSCYHTLLKVDKDYPLLRLSSSTSELSRYAYFKEIFAQLKFSMFIPPLWTSKHRKGEDSFVIPFYRKKRRT